LSPAHKQSDEATPVLSPVKWPVEFFRVSNAKGRETYICHDRIHQILSPAIQATCLLTPGQTLFFLTPPSNGGRFGGRMTPHPRRPLPTRPATPAQASPRGPDTQPNRAPPGNITVEVPTMRLDTYPHISHPQTPVDPMGIGTPHEEATAATVADSPDALGTRQRGRGYTSSQPLPDIEDISSSLSNTLKGTLPSLTRPLHHTHGHRSSYRTNGSTPTAPT
jgi:hypothetical protein